jgi:SAM-dependent methyltransferase
MPTVNAYGSDLAYIHDVGFGNFARRSAPGLLKLIRRGGKARGLVVDLGCGSGIWARELCSAGYDALGIDISEAMIALARKRVPQAEFRKGSFLTAKLPPCVAVTALGECFSYLFDAGNTKRGLSRFFRRIYEILRPGGLLIFDVATPGRVPGPGPQRSYREGDDWVVLVAAREDHKLLTRWITTFRKVGALYRRDCEVHRLRLFKGPELAEQLRDTGFRVRTLKGYGRARFPRGHIGLLARKPE